MKTLKQAKRALQEAKNRERIANTKQAIGSASGKVKRFSSGLLGRFKNKEEQSIYK